MLCGDAKSRHEPLLVKTDNHLIANEDNRHAHLARLLNHFLTLLKVVRDIKFGISNALALKEIFGHLAEVAGRRTVNSDGFVHVYRVMRPVYHAELSPPLRLEKGIYCRVDFYEHFLIPGGVWMKTISQIINVQNIPHRNIIYVIRLGDLPHSLIIFL